MKNFMRNAMKRNEMERIMQNRMPLDMWFPGYFSVCIEGDYVQKTLAICSFRKIDLYDISLLNDENVKMNTEAVNNTKKYFCKVSCKNYEELKNVCQKTNNELTILSVHGWLLMKEKLKKSASFYIGMLFAVCLILFFQSRIWDIRVEGNVYYDNPIILSFLREKDVTVGMKTKAVSCITLADQIREAFPKIKWTSVELKGTNLIVHIKENMHIQMDVEKQTKDTSKKQTKDQTKNTTNIKSENQVKDENTLSNIIVNNNLIAPKSGIVHSIYVRSGIANVKAGDTCKKGDILVKGQIPICNDAGEVVRYETVEADADVVLQYDQSYYDTVDREVLEYHLKDIDKGFQLQIFDYSIKPYSFGNKVDAKESSRNTLEARVSKHDTNSLEQKMRKEELTETKQLKITSAFTLPIYYGSNITYKYEEIPRKLTKSETKSILEKEISYFCDDLEKKGVQIYKNSVKIDVLNNKGIAYGKVTLLELVR